MIWTITPNPAMDITYHLPALNLGQSHRVEDVTIRPGGKGLNVAFVAAQMGVDVQVVGFLGGSVGQDIAQLTTARAKSLPGSITPHWLDGPELTRKSIAIVADGDATVFNEAGSPLKQGAWEALYRLVQEEIGPDDIVTINGSLPALAPIDALGKLVEHCQQAGAYTIVDTSGPALLAAARSGARLLKPNHLELAQVTGTDSVLTGAHTLLAEGKPGMWLAVSMGEKGMALIRSLPDDADVLDIWQAFPASRLDGNPTGAGDASVAALAVHAPALVNPGGRSEHQIRILPDLLEENDPSQALKGDLPGEALALKTAVAWSAAAVLKPVAGSIDEHAASSMFSSIPVHHYYAKVQK
ncbi:MAG: PfkB family carbohydrate kinase [Actinomycetaceae bacterium]|nr:PfkB family carbohydrate kinase [Actinomycetaceae bacterium]